MTSVLLVGASGTVGEGLIREWPGDWLVTGTALRAHGHALFEPLDVMRADAVAELLDRVAPTVVVNAAAMADVDGCERAPALSECINMEGAATLARLCRVRDVRLVHISTDYVFDGAAGPYSEDDVPAPINVYGHHKLQGERLVREIAPSSLVVRTCVVFGSGAPSDISVRLGQALSLGKTVQFSAAHYNSPTHVGDLAHGIRLLIDHDAEGIYHLAGAQTCSRADFARAVAQAYSLDPGLIQPSFDDAPGRAPRPRRAGLRIDKAFRNVGYVPHSLENALKTAHAAWQARQ